MAPKAMHKKPAAQGKVKKPAAKLSEKHFQEAMRKKEDVSVSTDGMTEVTMELSMAERLDEKKLPEVKAVVENDIPVKLGSTPEGFVHWKIDYKRAQDATKEKAKQLQAGKFMDVLEHAKQKGILK